MVRTEYSGSKGESWPSHLIRWRL